MSGRASGFNFLAIRPSCLSPVSVNNERGRFVSFNHNVKYTRYIRTRTSLPMLQSFYATFFSETGVLINCLCTSASFPL